MQVASAPQQHDDEEEESAALLLRLQAQFGDIDVSTMLNLGSDLSADGNERQDEGGKGDGEDDGEEEEEEASSDESSVVDPSPEEVRVWQGAQYKLAQWAREGREAAGIDASGHSAQTLTSREDTEDGRGEGWVRIEGPPDLDGQESAFFADGRRQRQQQEQQGQADPLLAQIAAVDPNALGGKWRRLYSSNDDGLSYARLLASLRGYGGPTVLMIGAVPSAAHSIPSSSTTAAASRQQQQKTGTLGLYTSTPWRESGSHYGNNDCFLFRVDDHHGSSTCSDNASEDMVHVFRPMEGERNHRYMSCRSTTAAAISADTRIAVEQSQAHQAKAKNGSTISSSSLDNIPAGIGIGGGTAGGQMYGPRLHITESFESCRALPYDGTFEAGPLLPPFFGSVTGGGGSRRSSATDDNANNNSTSTNSTSNNNNNGGDGHGGGMHYFDVDVMEAWGVGGTETIQCALKARGKDRELAAAAMRKIRHVDKMQFVDHLKSDIVHSKAFAHCQQTQGRCGMDDDESLESAV